MYPPPSRVSATLLTLARLAVVLSTLALAVPQLSQVHAATPRGSARLEGDFVRASREFGVPLSVLLAVSYNETRWDDHGEAPSTSGGYGPMHLTHVDRVSIIDGKGDGVPRSTRYDPALHTLDEAARLLHLSMNALKRDPAENISGGAALLAHEAVLTTGTRPRNPSKWFGAVAAYSGSANAATARGFADDVFATIRTGAARTTLQGQYVFLRALSVAPDRATSARLHLQQNPPTQAECPRSLACRFVPAAFEAINPADPTDYGNYNAANRPANGLAIRYIVIHDTEAPYDSAVRSFQDPTRYASANYVIRSSDGQVTQMVPDEAIAWHAGNYFVNMHAIGIEHEGVAVQGATWYNERLYQASARLVRYLAKRYHVPLDRAHILGHDEVPGLDPATQSGQHWDPGPFWDWGHYMDLLKAPIGGTGAQSDGTLVTINPDFASNQPPISYCPTMSTCHSLPEQGANFVYLYTAPRPDAPLLGDPALHGASTAGTTQANDWGDKAVAGQQFALVDEQPGWDAIDYGGQEAWIHDPNGDLVTFSGAGQLVTPKDGLSSIHVYGMAYPYRANYPSWIPRKDIQHIVPLQYSITVGQRYVFVGQVSADYYWAPTRTKHAVVKGPTLYDQIFFNHRFAFVKASNVDFLPAG